MNETEIKPASYRWVEPDGVPSVTFVGVADEDLREGVWDLLTEHLDTETVDAYRHVYPLDFLSDYHALLVRYAASHDLAGEETTAFLDRLAKEAERHGGVYASRLAQGVLELRDLPRLFPAGSRAWIPSLRLAGIVRRVRAVETFVGPQVDACLEVVHAYDGGLKVGVYTARFPGFKGLGAVSGLPVQLLDEATEAVLSARGERFGASFKPGTYLGYRGAIAQPNYWGARCFRADGRVIVDGPSFKRLAVDTWRDAWQAAGMGPEATATAAEAFSELPASERWRCVPYLYGFSFAAKQWGRIEVENLQPISWRDDAFDRLVMNAEDKSLIRSLVQHHGSSFSDGKGGGCIFLLHGEPGQGKTMSAEAVAELLHKPLYAVSVGELGTSPDGLEDRLRQILDVATVWDAVVLLDEADIFLEARDEKDIARNAMVGVFLRLLEYHAGVLFLTTNRVRQIDRAFYSRISVALRFLAADADKRGKIWSSLLAAAGLDPDWASDLLRYDLNGRQIKNAIRMAQTLARAESRPAAASDLHRAVSVALRFERDMHADQTGRSTNPVVRWWRRWVRGD